MANRCPCRLARSIRRVLVGIRRYSGDLGRKYKKARTHTTVVGNPRWRCGNALLSDTEPAESPVQHVVCVDSADHLAKLTESQSQFRRDQFLSAALGIQ